ncbi:hypothetical protein [Croceicoccus naphthovorans]|uniref:hypothetical protein n=1 Tax=Croceicoccus naphthovorans TaxID=1348774 RepID=UPI0012E011FD|nr:hypothetical protein [Croceicoccus naphthovorans]MBB3990846.1 hypothetical protein [Croceicoccus naphthovorans]
MNWEAISAIGQVAGAAATLAAVIVSLRLARRASRPNLTVSLREQLILIGDDTEHVMTFSVVNVGGRDAEVRSLGWRTGWFKWGPEWMRLRHAVQMFEPRIGMLSPPYIIAPGSEVSSRIGRDNILQHAERFGRTGPLFTRKAPWGIITTRTVIQAYTADGYRFRGKVERSALKKLANAERDGRRAVEIGAFSK